MNRNETLYVETTKCKIYFIYTIDHWIFFWANNLLNVYLRIHKMNVNRLQ